MHPVLIESDWNLNLIVILTVLSPFIVLIESDWNLNKVNSNGYVYESNSINRIRLEFKFYALDCRRGDSLKY